MKHVMIAVAAAVCAFATIAPAEAQALASREHDRAPSFHARPSPLEDGNPMRDEAKLVKHEFTIDTSNPIITVPLWGSLANSHLSFVVASSNVLFTRDIRSIENWSPDKFKNTMVHLSYDDLGLLEGHRKKKVIVYSNPHFMWIEVSKSHKSMTDVANALFFVGPTPAEHKTELESGDHDIYSYKEFKTLVSDRCAAHVRKRECPSNDAARFLVTINTRNR